MLLLGSSVLVDDITVFPDHADPNQFWYLPGPVKLATDSSGQPVFTLITFRPAAVQAGVRGGGFLMFQVNLALDAQTRQKILGTVSATASGEARLSPVLFDGGTVQCVALNVQGSGGTIAPGPKEGTFNAVEQIMGASTPSLAGNNDAIFSLVLSEEGALILNAAFEQRARPVGVIYALEFSGIRPALDVEITVDYKRIYDELSIGVDASVYFVQAGVEAVIAKLEQQGAITIKVTVMSDAADAAQKKQWALDFFRDKLLAEWFSPSLAPIPQPTSGTALPGTVNPGPFPGRPGTVGTPPVGGGGGQVLPPPGTGGTGGTTAPPPDGGTGGTTAPPPDGGTGGTTAPPPDGGTGGTTAPPPDGGIGGTTAPPPDGGTGSGNEGAPRDSAAVRALPAALANASVSLRLRKVNSTDLKKVTFRYSEQEAVKRPYAPQGFFSLLGDLDASHFIPVDLHDPFFQTLNIEVDPPPSPEGIGLLATHVTAEYVDSNDPTNRHFGDVTFVPGMPKHQFSWSMSPSFDLGYTYSVAYKFDPSSGWTGKELTVEVPPSTTTKHYLSLDPREFLGFIEVTVIPGQIDTALVAQTEVHLKYKEPDGWEASTQLLVAADSQPKFWRVRASDKTAKTFEYTFVHHMTDGEMRTTEPKTTDASIVVVNDPFPGYLQLVFVPVFDAATTRHVYVDITYDDEPNDYHRRERVKILGTDTEDVTLRIALVDETLTSFTYQLTFVTSGDNKVVQLPPVTTDTAIVAVSQ